MQKTIIISQCVTNLFKYGVSNNFNVPINNCLDQNFPYSESFQMDDGTTKISSAILYYTVKKYSESSCEIIQDYEPPKDFIRVLIDDEEAATISNMEGSIDLTEYITTQAGWHEIAFLSTAPVFIKGRLAVRSFIK